VIPDDLIKFGLIPELVGRMPVHSTLHELDENALIDILTKPKNAICKQYKKLFEIEDVKLDFTKDALQAIAKTAIKQKIGARGLRTIMEKFMNGIMYDLPDKSNIKQCTISREVVDKNKEPVYVYKPDDKDQTA